MDNQFPSEQTLNLGIDVAGVAHPEEPGKRRPGRPKGSTKKHLLGTSPAPIKTKRPVGRPRKDGLPAGSVGPSRPKRETQPAAGYQPQAVESGFQGVAYPPPAMGMYQQPPPVPFVPPPIIQIDPSLTGEEWSTMSRNDPNAFLSILLQALAAPNPVSAGGPSVEDAFKLHLVSLAPTANQVAHLPSLYSILKTFWLPSSPAYFSLTSSASNSRTPCEHRFLYWDPLPLVFNGIACPACSQPLINKGRITSGPVKIYDIEKPFFIIGCEYVCKSMQCATPSSPEGRRFASTDATILRSLPAKLKDEFPAKLLHDGDADAGCGPNIWNWRALGVSISLWNMVLGAIRLGLKREVILHLIHSIQHGVPPPDLRRPEVEASSSQEQHLTPEVPPPPIGHPEDEMQQQQTEPPPPQNYSDTYSEPWKDPSAKSPPPPSQTPQQPPAPVASPPVQPFGYAQAPYPFAPYGYMGASLMPPPPHEVPLVPGPPQQQPQQQQKENNAQASASTTTTTTKRSPRHCCKCGSQDCKGKGGRNFCMNACQDCGKLDCKGRNSRRPDKKCSEGWS
ncbi:hypothetical protein BKA70DRAFT_1371872 [Coprinopsis sp. MPI-PUGE-AT-0042]|nr:hypothetical protein BKA70DRAFT_1371872 [Coprinopsis sp. MPI-PUGE-AT-0042]